MKLNFLCYDFAVDGRQYQSDAKSFFAGFPVKNGALDLESLKSQGELTASVDAEYEECFNRTELLSAICNADEVDYSSYKDIVANSSAYSFGFKTVYEPETDNFNLYMFEEYIGSEKVPLNENEQKELNSAVSSFIEYAIEKYKNEKENAFMEKSAYNDEYCSRVFYDITHEDYKSAEEAFSVIKPALADFFKSDEYADATIGLYEAAANYISSHDFPEPDETVLESEDFKKFEAFVSKYTELSKKGVEFTIDDKVFDKTNFDNTVSKEF